MTIGKRAVAADIAKSYVTTPAMVAIIVGVLGIAGMIWSLKTDVQILDIKIGYEAKAREDDKTTRAAEKESIMSALRAVEAKVEARANGAAALSAMQELERLRAENTKLQQQLRGR